MWYNYIVHHKWRSQVDSTTDTAPETVTASSTTIIPQTTIVTTDAVVTSVTVEEAIHSLEITETVRCLPIFEQGKFYDKTGAKAKVVVIEAGTSKNKNIYRPEVLQKSIGRFEGAKVFYNHKDENRDFRDLAGEITGVTMEGNRVVGTLEVLEADQWLRSVIRQKPHLVGLSIYCWASAKKTDDGELIEEIQSVRSVDIVDSPAAGGGVLNVLENQLSSNVAPDEQIERKESIVDEKQVAEKIAALEKALSEKEIALAEAIKAQEVIKAEAEKNIALNLSLRDAAIAKIVAYERKDLVESFLAEKRAAGLKPSVEGAIRRAVEGVADLNREALDKAHAEWTKVAEDIAKDYAPKAEAPVLTAGLPPRTEAPVAAPEQKKEAVAPTARKSAAGFIDALVGVKA